MDHTRHSALFDVSNYNATLIGCGGIGAATALALVKMGLGSLMIVDDDTVNPLNLATQLHRLSDVGKPKVTALAEMLAGFSDDTEIIAHKGRFHRLYPLIDQFVISAVDSIQSRKDIWFSVRNGRVSWYLDARMAAEEFHLYCVDMADPGWYEDILVEEDDQTVAELPCTSKATIYTAFIAAGLIGAAVKGIRVGEIPPRLSVFNIRKLDLLNLR